MEYATIIFILAIGGLCWFTLGWDSDKPKRTYGNCDNPLCDEKATVHYGLEEFYCEACDRHTNGRS